jgi:TetR/AcrR family transcriptional regulator, transcriptional repressor for nem operon
VTETVVPAAGSVPSTVPSNGRVPTTERGRRSRAALVEAAATLMYERGIEHTSIDDVLAYCGAGKSQMYHYFATKHELVCAVINLQYANVVAGQPRLERLHSWRDFELWSSAFLARHETSAGPLACRLGRFAAEVDADPTLRAVLAAAFAAWEAHLARGLEHLQHDGRLRPDADPVALASATMAAVQGGILLSRLYRDSAPLRHAMAMAMAHLRSFAD